MADNLKQWSGTSSFNRRNEKAETVLMWLADWQYSTREILCQLLGVSSMTGQHAFFKAMLKAELIQSVTLNQLREQLYMLTAKGSEVLSSFSVREYLLTTSAYKLSSWQIPHNLSAQIAVLHYTRDPNVVYSYRHLPITDSRAKRPDAIITSGLEPIAVEVELNTKSKDRTYRGFLDSIENIKAGYYQRVHYVFHRPNIAALYRERFNELAWPIFDRDPHVNRLVPRMNGDLPMKFNADNPKVRALFTFEVRSLYSRGTIC